MKNRLILVVSPIFQEMYKDLKGVIDQEDELLKVIHNFLCNVNNNNMKRSISKHEVRSVVFPLITIRPLGLMGSL